MWVGSVGGVRRESGRSCKRAPGVSWGGKRLSRPHQNQHPGCLTEQPILIVCGFPICEANIKKKKNPKINRIARSLPGMRGAAREIESPDTRIPRRGRTFSSQTVNKGPFHGLVGATFFTFFCFLFVMFKMASKP